MSGILNDITPQKNPNKTYFKQSPKPLQGAIQ